MVYFMNNFFFTLFICLFSFSANASDYIVAGVIRNTGDGWNVINDNGHNSINICSVSNDEKIITIKYCDKVDKVITFLCVSDETYLKYSCGSSVSRDEARLYLLKSSNGKRINPNKLNNKNGNFWVYGLFKPDNK